MTDSKNNTIAEDKEGTTHAPAPILYINRKRHAEQTISDSPPIWLISFTDVIALMLTFFVLLYAMSDPDPERFDRKMGITESARAQFSGPRGEAGSAEGQNMNRLNYESAENLDYLQAILEENLEKHNAMSFTKINRQGNDIALHFSSSIKGNEAVFIKFINELSPFLQNLDNSVALVGSLRQDNSFPTLQSLGQRMKERGYSKPIRLATRHPSSSSASNIAIYIQPHTGRRVE